MLGLTPVSSVENVIALNVQWIVMGVPPGAAKSGHGPASALVARCEGVDLGNGVIAVDTAQSVGAKRSWALRSSVAVAPHALQVAAEGG